MKKKYKIPLIVLVVCAIFIIGLIVLKNIRKSEVKNDVKVVDSIVDFSYTLDERDSALMKSTYNELKKVLKEKNINFEDYSKEIAKLFIIDLFTMNNKVNKYDVASLEYVYPDSLDNFKLNVEDTLYKIIEDNTYGKRNQTLPYVSSINVTDTNESKYKIGEEELDAYEVTLNWEYEKDLGYDKNGVVTLVKKDKKVYVVEYKAGVVNE